jgi:uncharacterized membrane protein YhaH (DUF805 family)
MKRFAVDGGPIRVFASLRLVTRGASVDFKQFYLSADGRVNRKQWWLYLILPAFIISIIASIIDASTGHDPQQGIGPITAIFSLLILYPSIVVYIKRFHDRDKSGWWVLSHSSPSSGRSGSSSNAGSSRGRRGLIGSVRPLRIDEEQAML